MKFVNNQFEMFEVVTNLKDRYTLTTKEAAEFLGVSRRWLEENRLQPDAIPYFKLCRKIVYKAKDITDWMNRRKKLAKERLKCDQNEKIS